MPQALTQPLSRGCDTGLELGKRLRTTPTPTLALQEGKSCRARGAPGGDAQDRSNLQFLLDARRSGIEATACGIAVSKLRMGPKPGLPGSGPSGTLPPS